ncbi:MAG: hypothetical protein NZ874_05085, partial [Fimbriimonadales bacterium]|nr:hypothetical protein [Fimbriimonadales bacterium]
GRFLNRRKGTPEKTPANLVEFNPSTHYWAEVVIAPIYDEQGQLLGYCGIQYEITDTVLREQESARQAQMQQLLTRLAMLLQGGGATDGTLGSGATGVD